MSGMVRHSEKHLIVLKDIGDFLFMLFGFLKEMIEHGSLKFNPISISLQRQCEAYSPKVEIFKGSHRETRSRKNHEVNYTIHFSASRFLNLHKI